MKTAEVGVYRSAVDVPQVQNGGKPRQIPFDS
jgi:hypothetical protein